MHSARLAKEWAYFLPSFFFPASVVRGFVRPSEEDVGLACHGEYHTDCRVTPCLSTNLFETELRDPYAVTVRVSSFPREFVFF